MLATKALICVSPRQIYLFTALINVLLVEDMAADENWLFLLLTNTELQLLLDLGNEHVLSIL